jgi:trans-aconitate methyltransferase
MNTVSANKDLIWTRPWHWERNRFVRFRTAYTFERFVNLPRDHALRILDFGSGQGHSIDVLLERYPNGRFVCADIATADLAKL